MITGVTLDGVHRYCMPESLIPGKGTNGFGLYNEFGIEEPVGYFYAAVGEKFPKLGVGLLTKYEEDDYKFFENYQTDEFERIIHKSESSITFEVNPKECRGYAARQIKAVSIDENRMKISHMLENTGTKPIVTTEYSHNFVAIDNNPIGPEHLLRFSFDIDMDREVEVFDVRGKELKWKHPAKEEFYCRFNSLPKECGQFWELIYEPSGAGLREKVNFPIERAAIWGTSHVASPEFFIKLNVDPGEKVCWEREYEFFKR
jgi:hypothetical protein